MKITTTINETPENLQRNIHSSVDRRLAEFKPEDINNRIMTIVASGPSLGNHLEDLKENQKRGDLIVCVNGSHDWLIHHEVVPDTLVLCDALPSISDLFTPHPDVDYLVASQCHPKVFDKLKGYKVTIWHSWLSNESLGCPIESIVDKHGVKGWIVYGGGTAALRCLNLGYLMGFRKFVYFGLDSSFLGERHHVAGGNKGDPIELEYQGQSFDTDKSLASQAQDFEDLYSITFNDCRIDAIGEGLIPIICRSLNTAKYGRPYTLTT